AASPAFGGCSSLTLGGLTPVSALVRTAIGPTPKDGGCISASWADPCCSAEEFNRIPAGSSDFLCALQHKGAKAVLTAGAYVNAQLGEMAGTGMSFFRPAYGQSLADGWLALADGLADDRSAGADLRGRGLSSSKTVSLTLPLSCLSTHVCSS